MTKFVVFGLQRTGTSWIETLLDSHPNIRCLGEIFYFYKGRFPLREPRGRKTEMSYRRHIESSRKKRIMHYIAKRRSVHELLKELYSLPGYSAIGFKLMYDQAGQFPMILDYAQEHEIRVIHVVRKNVLKTLISLISAKQRKLVHATENVMVSRVSIPTPLLLWRLKRISKLNKQWETFFSEFGQSYIKIEYESMLNNGEKEQKRLLSFLGVSTNMKLTSPLKKINPNNLKDIVANYAELQKLLTNTIYEWCLE